MADGSIVHAGSAPWTRRRLTPEEGIALWADLMDACEQFLLAGLRRKVGPQGDLAGAYRDWYARQMEEHDRMILRMVQEFNRRSGGRAE